MTVRRPPRLPFCGNQKPAKVRTLVDRVCTTKPYENEASRIYKTDIYLTGDNDKLKLARAGLLLPGAQTLPVYPDTEILLHNGRKSA